MTPIVGLVIAIIAGFVATRPRSAFGIVVPLMLGATAAQSWYLGTGRGKNPPSTTTEDPSYWLVQVLIVAAICGVAAGVCWVRFRFGGAERRAIEVGQRVVLLGVGAVAAFAGTLGLMFVTDRPVHSGMGTGQVPVGGLIAAPLGLVVLVAFGIAWLRQARQSANA